MKTKTPASTYAQTLTSWSEDNWWMLEEAALSNHREARFALLGLAPTRIMKRVPTRGTLPKWATPCVLLIILTEIAAPIVTGALALGILAHLIQWFSDGGDVALDPELLIAVGITSLTATVLAVKTLILDRRKTEDSSGWKIMSIIQLGTGAPALLIASLTVLVGAVENSHAWWVLPILLHAITGVLYWRKHVRTGAETELFGQEAVDRALSRLNLNQKNQIAEDLLAALNLLQERELLDERLIEQAKSTPMGHLGSTFSLTRSEEAELKEGQ